MIFLSNINFKNTEYSYQTTPQKIGEHNPILKHPQNSAIIQKDKLPYLMFKGYFMAELNNNEDRNKIWTKKFDETFESKDCRGFLKFINEKTRLAPLFDPTIEEDIIQSKLNNNFENTDFPVEKASLTAVSKFNNINVTADKSGHIQINNSYSGNLFITREELDKEKNMDSVSKDIIADGARGFDPFDQEDWGKAIGHKWPTAENTRDPKGVAKLSIDNSNKAIFLDTNNSIADSYGTKPRAVTILDSENDSVVLAFQQENQNPDINFAAWSILPFKIRENKKTLTIFPADKKSIKTFSKLKENAQMNLNSGKFFVIDVSKPSQKTEYIDPYADWCIFATQDDDTICLVRSCYKDNTDDKQFKIFSGHEDLGGTKYTELEFIAPKVSKGQKSTLVYRIDFIPVKKLGIESLTAENMDKNIKKIGEVVEQKINKKRAEAPLTMSQI